MCFEYFKKFIKEKLDKDGLTEKHKICKTQIYQLYMVIDKQTEENLAKFNFIMNFGVSTDSKRILLSAIQGNPSYAQFISKISQIPLREVLIIYKYLVYSDKKIHHIMYKETADDISDNLLNDFLDSDDETKIIDPKALSNSKNSNNKKQQLDPKIRVADMTKNKRFDPNDFGK